MDTKEIKRQIRALRKCRKDTRKYTEERRDINERIRDLKAQLTPVIKEVDDTKEKLIAIKDKYKDNEPKKKFNINLN